ncbi:MAG TPA: efflux transporter outer membrane subunit, partial [Dokdonella sp.]
MQGRHERSNDESPRDRAGILPHAACALVAAALCACAPFRASPNRNSMRAAAPVEGVVAEPAAPWPGERWWIDYRRPDLDRLIEQALSAAPTLDVVRARFAIAASQVEAARAEARPQLDVAGGASRSHVGTSTATSSASASPPPATGETPAQPGASSGATLPDWNSAVFAGAAVRYEFDWWGAKRAAVESALDAAHAGAAETRAAAWLLEYAIASTYFDWNATQLRLALARRAVELQSERLRIAEFRGGRGLDTPQAAENVRADLAQAEQNVAALDAAARTDEASLAALLGVAPAALPALQAAPLPAAATAVPDDLKLGLVSRRPDLAASRWRVEAAAREVDVARGAFYPTVSVSALAAVLNSRPTPGASTTLRFLDVGLSAYLPLLDGGRVQARYDTSQRELDEAIAEYNQSLVAAASDVARAKVALDGAREQRARRGGAAAADETAFAIGRTRETSGVGDPRDTLAAELALVEQRDALAELDGRLVAADLGLIRALGGG